MKKLLLVAAFAMFAFTSAHSQEFRFGVKAGLNMASIGGDDTDMDGRTSFHVGGLMEIVLSDKFSLQPEILYSSQGAKQEESYSFFGVDVEEKITMKLDYINVPIMAKYYIIEGLAVEAGPQIGVLISAKVDAEMSGGGESESESADIKEYLNTLDIGFGFGASYRLDMGVFFGARYVLGVSNINKDSDDGKNQNNVFQLSAGYTF